MGTEQAETEMRISGGDRDEYYRDEDKDRIRDKDRLKQSHLMDRRGRRDRDGLEQKRRQT